MKDQPPIPLPLSNPFRKITHVVAAIRIGRNVKTPDICYIFVLLLGMMFDGNAASTLKMTCTGNLTNTRTDGVTLGQCDLNFISVKQMDEIEGVCGIPGTVDTLLKINVEYEQWFHPIQFSPLIRGSYTRSLSCCRWINALRLRASHNE